MVRVFVAIGAAALVLATSPAVGEPDARKEPSVSGPLVLERKGCEDPVKTRSDTGEVGIVTRKCLWLYQYDPAKDSSDRDWGVAWVQTYFSPRNGWCLKWAESGVLNNDKHIVRKASAKGSFGSSRAVTVKLNGTPNAKPQPSAAAIKQKFQVLPGKFSNSTVQGGRFFKSVWEGATKKPVTFAVGIQMWWDPATQSEPNAGASLESKLRRNC